MASREDTEARLFQRLLEMFREWLAKVRDAVLAMWARFQLPPDPAGVYQTVPLWNRMVDDFLEEELEPLASTGTFAMSQLAQTRNLLVRIPDEVYSLIFAELADATANGEDTYSTATRIERILTVTGSQRWPNRAHVIAITETTRALNAGQLGSAFQAQQREQVGMRKRWLDSDDRQVRETHQEADGQEQPLEQPFRVGDSFLMFPGDPVGAPEEVINCRCSMLILAEGEQ